MIFIPHNQVVIGFGPRWAHKLKKPQAAKSLIVAAFLLFAF